MLARVLVAAVDGIVVEGRNGLGHGDSRRVRTRYSEEQTRRWWKAAVRGGYGGS